MSLITENIRIFGEYTDLKQAKELKDFSNIGSMLKYCFDTYKKDIAFVDKNINYTYENLDVNTGLIRYKLNYLMFYNLLF